MYSPGYPDGLLATDKTPYGVLVPTPTLPSFLIVSLLVEEVDPSLAVLKNISDGLEVAEGVPSTMQ
jgi:hypothetical protein